MRQETRECDWEPLVLITRFFFFVNFSFQETSWWRNLFIHSPNGDRALAHVSTRYAVPVNNYACSCVRSNGAMTQQCVCTSVPTLFWVQCRLEQCWCS
jgi:hypothetical protein